MYGVANRPNGTAHKYFASALAQNRGEISTAQVFGPKANETRTMRIKSPTPALIHKLMTAFAPYNPRRRRDHP